MPPRPASSDSPAPGSAWFAGRRATGVLEHADLAARPDALTTPGWWALVGEFEGRVDAWRFAHVENDVPGEAEAWSGPRRDAWTTSLDRAAYVAAVERVRSHVRDGVVYQANVCRVMQAPLPRSDGREPDARALAARLVSGNPAPYAGGVHVPADGDVPGAWVVTASPELYLRVRGGVVTSGPIKGTAATPEGLTAKDRAENVMITDLVRNDLQRVSAPGTVRVTDLLGTEHHPGLVHLVSTVEGELLPAVRDAPDLLPRVLDGTYPPGSVSGAPKSSALRVIRELEPVPRGPYCGLVGWAHVGTDGRLTAELAVGIRTFWWRDEVLRFGTGAGITWSSDAEREWAETELKAARLVALASRDVDHPAPAPAVAG